MMTDFTRIPPLSHEGDLFELYLLDRHACAKLPDQVEAGNNLARELGHAIIKWTEQISSGIAKGVQPACAYCGMVLHGPSRDDANSRGNIGGYAILLPRGGKMGLTSALCEMCSKRDQQELQQKVLDSIEDELGAEVSRVQ